MNKYLENKEKARNKAIEIQYDLSNKCLSYMELANITEKLYKLGKKYGLLKEFRENGLV